MISSNTHAEREFKALGYIPLDQEQEDGPNKWIQENLLELLAVFDKQGHSGASASYVISCFSKLARYEPLSPIKGTDDEWGTRCGGHQNNRLSSVFKDDDNGRPYYINAISWRTQKGSSWGGYALDSKGNKVTSRQFIRLPFMPKTFHVDVIEKEIAKDSWEFYIKDDRHLDEVFKYYDREVK